MNTKKPLNNELWDKFRKQMLSKGVTNKRLKKLQCMYTAVSRGIKNMDNPSKEDIEDFIFLLNDDKFRTQSGKRYGASTKADIKKFLKQFYKWKLGEGYMYPKQVAWIDTKIPKDMKPKEKPVITFKQAKIISNKMTKPEFKIATLILFDSGFRIQELMSVEKKDLTWEDYDDKGNKCFWIHCNQSKTFTRKVPLALITKEISTFKDTQYFEQLSDNELLFQFTYDHYRDVLRKTAKKIIGFDITPHVLRHSSVTHYWGEYEGNQQMICDRYGWSYNAKELPLYARRNGQNSLKKGTKKLYQNEAIKLREENQELKDRLEKLENSFKTVCESHAEILRRIDSFNSKGTPLNMGYEETKGGKTFIKN